MIATGETVFVDTEAWIALAEARDPLHTRAREQWAALTEVGARLSTSVPVIIETFTFLDCGASHDAALQWKASLDHARARSPEAQAQAIPALRPLIGQRVALTTETVAQAAGGKLSP